MLDVLVKQAPDLPQWLRLVTTTRPEAPILQRVRNLNVFELQADRPENRSDVRDFLALAAEIPIHPEVQEYPLESANQALRELKERKIRGAKVLRVAAP